MSPLRRSMIAAVAVVAAVVSFTVTTIVVNRGATPLLVHPMLGVVLIAGAGALIQAGRAVRRLKRREPTRLTPPQAAMIALAARAAAVVGALGTGHMGAQVVVALLAGDSALMSAQAIGAAVCAGASLALTIAGMVVEAWCTIDDNDDDTAGGRGVHASPA